MLGIRISRSELDGVPWIREEAGDKGASSLSTYTLAQFYHQNSKYHRDLMVKEPMNVATALAIPRRAFTGEIGLPEASADLPISLGQALRHRRSVRKFRYGTMGQQTLADLLYYSAGVTGIQSEYWHGRPVRIPVRSYPSAGALFPIDLFLIVRNVEGVTPGVYHYNPVRHSLVPHPTAPEAHLSCLNLSPMHPEHLELYNTQLLVVPVATFQRQVAKYQQRGYRYTLQESGHIAENLMLVAVSLGLGGLSMGAYYDDELHALLGLDGLNECALYLIPIGLPEVLEPWDNKGG